VAVQAGEERGDGGRVPPFAAARLAWSAFLVSLVFAALSAVFQVLNRAAGNPGHPYWASNAVGAVTFGLLGALAASRRPDHRIGWLFCAAGLLSAVGVFAGEYGPYAAMTMDTPAAQAGGAVAMWVGNWSWWLVFIPMLLMLLLFPSGRFPSRGWKEGNAVARMRRGHCAVGRLAVVMRLRRNRCVTLPRRRVSCSSAARSGWRRRPCI
jgi:hypothetical protein